jgi:hypothetical protein
MRALLHPMCGHQGNRRVEQTRGVLRDAPVTAKLATRIWSPRGLSVDQTQGPWSTPVTRAFSIYGTWRHRSVQVGGSLVLDDLDL